MGDVVLQVERLSKKFCRRLRQSLWYGLKDMAAELFLKSGPRDTLRKNEFWALKDISFELRRGEMLGLIGHNGAGKSTLLKLINGLIRPDQGCIRVRGRVGALISLGAGFNPRLTGRENIYVNASVLGLKKREIDRRLGEIIDFAEIDEFIDAPLQTYSSGMKVRLGFSVAANLNPDVLLIDEVLSVGDSSFRERCLRRLDEYREGGGTAIFVSHNSAAVEAISDRVMMLDHGTVALLGEPGDTVHEYERQAGWRSKIAEMRLAGGQPHAAEAVTITSVRLLDADGRDRDVLEYAEPFEVRIEFDVAEALESPCFWAGFAKRGSTLFCNIPMEMSQSSRISPGRNVISCRVKNPRMTPGAYGIHAGVVRHRTGALGRKHYVAPRMFAAFEVRARHFSERYPDVPLSNLALLPPVLFDHEWQLLRAEEERR